MTDVRSQAWIVGPDDLLLVTGATGFIGTRLVENLLNRGFRRVRCLARSAQKAMKLRALAEQAGDTARVEIVEGNLLSPSDCTAATRDAAIVFHLAAARGEKSFPEAFLNSVVTTRNLLNATVENACVRRFVGVSSFAVYSNTGKRHWRLLDESAPVENDPKTRHDAYAFAKIKQEQLVIEYGRTAPVNYVIVRPGYVYGPGNLGISGRVGIDTFGVFLHLGGPNQMPFTYVDNCVDAIALSGVVSGIDGEVFNVVDDDLPSSRRFLAMYKRHVRRFRSLYIPHAATYGLCYLWERYSAWSEGQLPAVFSRKEWHASWKRTRYTNEKLKRLTGWAPQVSTEEGLSRYFDACRAKASHA